MDPFSQGIAGALFAQGAAAPEQQRRAMVLGAVGGMAPDIDVLIRSSNDPLLAFEFHRHFTHSLWFIPLGGLLVALLLWPFTRRRFKFGQVYLFISLGLASHGLLDACTAYGTMLYWPSSEQRVAWDILSIIDPLLTFPVLLLVALAAWRRSKRWWLLAATYAAVYLTAGLVQHQRAVQVQQLIAAQRGHVLEQARVMPGLGNLLVWRSVYRSDQQFHIDALRLGLDGQRWFWPGGRIPVWQEQIPEHTVLGKDIERFKHFSHDMLSLVYETADEILLGDARYGLLPNATHPLWGIRFNPNQPEQHVQIANFERSAESPRQALQQYWSMIKGTECHAPECLRLETD